MDVVKLRKRAVLIATPGQAEQEYLASHLGACGMAVIASQHKLNLKTAVAAAEKLVLPDSPGMDTYMHVIRELTTLLDNRKTAAVLTHS
jgi:hypothetical protein